MQDMDLKKKVLSEIMDLMDEKEGDSLKMHPKLVAAKLEVKKPESFEEPEKSFEIEPKDEDEDMSPEMVQKILEMYKDMK